MGTFTAEQNEFVKRKGSISKKVLQVDNFKFLSNTRQKFDKHSIPSEFVINCHSQQTGIHTAPVAQWTMEAEGSKREDISVV